MEYLYLVLSVSLVINLIESGGTAPAGDISRLRGGEIPHVSREWLLQATHLRSNVPVDKSPLPGIAGLFSIKMLRKYASCLCKVSSQLEGERVHWRYLYWLGSIYLRTYWVGNLDSREAPPPPPPPTCSESLCLANIITSCWEGDQQTRLAPQ